MMRGEERHINIFNMSFLDVLCCTVGALIFILFIQILRTRDMVERQELEQTVTKLDQAKAELVRTEQAELQLQEEFERLRGSFQNVQNDIDAAKKEKEDLETGLSVAVNQLEGIRATAQKEKEVLEEEKQELEKEKEDLETELSVAVNQLEGIRATATTVKKEKEELEEEKQELEKEKEELESELSVAVNQLEGIRATATTAKKEKEELEEEKQELEKEKEDLESELTVAMARLKEVREELKEKDDTIMKLVQELQEPNLPEVAFVDLSDQDPNAFDKAGRSMETQKTAHGQYLLGNLETRSIVCVEKGFYLGLSRKVIPIQSNPDLEPLFRQFLRYHDPKQEGLWQTIWGNGTAAANLSLKMRASGSAIIGQGFILRPETFMDDAQQKATDRQLDMVALDTDEDGFEETRFEDADGNGTLDVKRVNVDSDAFFEELYLEYNAQRRQWTRLLVDTDGDNEYDLLLQDMLPADSDYEVKYIQPNPQTGSAVFRYEDGDNDGIWDTKEENIDMSNSYWEKRYLLFNPDAQRWQAISVDTDGDGRADILWRDTDMSNDDWEEKFVDENGDGQWDVYWKDLDPRDNDWEAKLTQPKAEKDIWQQCALDTNASGTFDTLLEDTDGDGEWDEERPILEGEKEGEQTRK